MSNRNILTSLLLISIASTNLYSGLCGEDTLTGFGEVKSRSDEGLRLVKLQDQDIERKISRATDTEKLRHVLSTEGLCSFNSLKDIDFSGKNLDFVVGVISTFDFNKNRNSRLNYSNFCRFRNAMELLGKICDVNAARAFVEAWNRAKGTEFELHVWNIAKRISAQVSWFPELKTKVISELNELRTANKREFKVNGRVKKRPLTIGLKILAKTDLDHDSRKIIEGFLNDSDFEVSRAADKIITSKRKK